MGNYLTSKICALYDRSTDAREASELEAQLLYNVCAYYGRHVSKLYTDLVSVFTENQQMLAQLGLDLSMKIVVNCTRQPTNEEREAKY